MGLVTSVEYWFRSARPYLASLAMDTLLDLRGSFSVVAAPLAIAGAALLASIAGLLAVLPALRTSPLTILR